MQSILEVKNLSYHYPNGDGINNISFDLERGDFLALVGKSGAGKSTLINSLLGIFSKIEGEVLVDDALSCQDISFSPQNQAIDWYLNVFDNVYMGALFSGVANAKAATLDILNKIGLKGKEHEELTNLSGGQVQRVQLARQLVADSEILILDEPTSSLDVITSETILEQLKSQTQLGKTCIVSSHDLDMLEKYCNKVLYIEAGQLAFFGSLSSFFERYSNANEYTLVYDGSLPEALVKKLKTAFNVVTFEPLTIELNEDQALNPLLELFLANGIKVRSVEQKKHSLKEIIQLKG